MKKDEKSRRIRERLALSLPVRVQCRESADLEWVEMTRIMDVTPFGARITIARPTEIGRLLHLTMAMPRQLRCFDHVEPQYLIWSLVRNVVALPPSGGDLPRHQIGVAFIGKRPPASFEIDPTKRYEVAASPTETGLWSLQEMSDSTATHLRTHVPRPETRHNMPIDMVVEVFDEKRAVSATERTVTENISRRGAAVFTTLNVAPGRFVRLTSAQYQISVTAVVRAHRAGADGIRRLHLEFVNQQWPLEGAE